LSEFKKKEAMEFVSPFMWAIGILVAIVVSVISIIIQEYYNQWWFLGWGPMAAVNTGAVISLFLMIAFGSILGMVKNKRVFGFFTILLSIIFMTASIGNQFYRFATVAGGLMHDLYKDVLGPVMPDYMFPKDLTVQNYLLTGGVSVPWDAWTVPILYWIIWSIIWSIYTIAIGLVVRQLWVKIEKLTFPTVRILTDTIEYAVTNGRWGIFSKKNTLFWIGWVIGFFIIGGHIWIQQFFPAFPSITPGAGGFNSYELISVLGRILPGGCWVFGLHPGLIAVAFLIPLDVTFSAVFFFVVKTIIDMVQVAMGQLPYDITWSGLTIMDQYGFIQTSSFRWYYVWGGAVMALGVMPLIIHRDYIIDTIRLAFKKKAKSLSEEGEPFSYTVVYTLLAIGFFGWLALLLIGQVPLYAALIWVITFGLLNLGWIRVMADCGYQQLDVMRMGANVVYSIYNGPEVVGKTGTYVLFNDIMLTSEFGHYSDIGPASLQLSKVGESTGLHQRDAYLAIILSAIIGNVIGWPLTVYLFNTFGQARLGGGTQFWWFAFIDNILGTSPMVQNGTDWWLHTDPIQSWYLPALLGVALVVILSIARIIWPTFPLNPIGLFVGGTYHMNWVWFPLVIGCIMKFIVLKIGGTSLYEKRAVPLIIGFIVGYFVTSLASVLILIAMGG